MRAQRRVSLTSAIVFCVITSALASIGRPLQAQEARDTETRLRMLEEKLKNHDALTARVAELEKEVARFEAAGAVAAPDPLELMINDRLARVADASVSAPRSKMLTLGGQLRFRLEWRDPFDYRIPGTFGRPANQNVGDDNDRVEQRIRLNLDARILDRLRAFVQLQDSRIWGEEGNVLADTEQVDLHQAYVDVEKVLCRPITLRVGRQELSYGDQRMISPLDWSNVGRSWDGVRAWYSGSRFQLDAFVTDVKEAVNGLTDDDQIFGGVYGSYTGIEAHWIDAYFLFRHDHDGTFASEGGEPGDREDAYVGARIKGSRCGFDYTGEAAYQFGDVAGDDVSAFGTAVTAGYTFGTEWSPRIGAEWTFGSGDEDPLDGEIGTFDPPYPFGHMYQGWMDIFAWKNGHDLALHLSAKPARDWTVGASLHHFLLDEASDAWYGASGRVIRRDPTGSAGNTLGQEIDLYAKWAVNPKLTLFFGYSHFFAGEFVEDTGPNPDQDWVWMQLTAEF
jgi:hypothetical protein